MDNNNTKEKAIGIWAVTGKQIEFNRIWSNHRFTDEEVSDLLAGKEITINGLRSKKGYTYGVIGKLSELSYNGNDYIGFERLKFTERTEVPDAWCQYKFSAAEKNTLEAGDSIPIKDAVGRSGKKFSCRVRFGRREDGSLGIIPEFD